VLVITRDPPANAQCISVDFKFWGGVPKVGVFLWLANILVLFVGGLVLDKLYSKLDRLLGIWVGGTEVIASMVLKTRLRLVVVGDSFDMGE
jgi:hypothetical protein